MIRKYGEDHVSQIVTFGTMGGRQAIRDVGRVMSMPRQLIDECARAVPFEKDMTIARAMELTPDLKRSYEENPDVKELLDRAMQIEGMPRHCGMHAAGVVITDKPVSDYVPLSKNDNNVVTQYTMTTLEELGLLKMDVRLVR